MLKGRGVVCCVCLICYSHYNVGHIHRGLALVKRLDPRLVWRGNEMLKDAQVIRDSA